MTTDTTERGLERLICTALAGSPCDPASPGTGATGEVRERPASTERGGSAAPPRTTTAQIWPRYHQLDVVRRLLADIARHGAARRTLVQHSAGSGKSNSIAWLAHQLIELAKDGAVVFDSIIVVTDRRILDQQIKDTIKQFMDNESFRRWLTDTIFGLTYKGPAAGGLTSRDVLSNKCRVDCGTGWRLERGRRLVLGGAGAAARRPWMRSSNAAWCTSRART